jgi:hypothetical protein
MKLPPLVTIDKSLIEKFSEELKNSTINNHKIINYKLKTTSKNDPNGLTLGDYFVEHKAKKIANILQEKYPNKKIWIEMYDNTTKIGTMIKENVSWTAVSHPQTKSFNQTILEKVHIDPEIEFDDVKKDIINKFLTFVGNWFNWDKLPSIIFTSNRNKGMTSGCYDISNEQAHVYCRNRSIADILRSLAHELVHHNQNITGQLKADKIPDVGGKIEDDANSIAGQIVKSFGKQENNSIIYDL